VSALVDAGTIIGTSEYFSPEQVVGQALDQRSDIYSLGIMLYQMLTGHVPFSGVTPMATAMQHVLAEPPSLSQLNPIISPAIEAVVLKALAKQPEQRYGSAGQLAQAFSAALTSTGIDLARPPWVASGKASELFRPMTLTNEDMLPSSAQVLPLNMVDNSSTLCKSSLGVFSSVGSPGRPSHPGVRPLLTSSAGPLPNHSTP
jgi:serine/threonine protein kinase